jgi:hypothetical protein
LDSRLKEMIRTARNVLPSNTPPLVNQKDNMIPFGGPQDVKDSNIFANLDAFYLSGRVSNSALDESGRSTEIGTW